MSNKVTTVNQSIVNTATKEITYDRNGEKIVKSTYSDTRFQIKNSGDLIDRPMPPELSPQQVKGIASTRDKLQYKENATYKLVKSYKVDYKRDEQGKKVPLATEDHFRVGIYAVPQAHALV
tara:strand:+ start:246 stop:608 length:363 start_codon:yes stop_codon:yes gene_type:complete